MIGNRREEEGGQNEPLSGRGMLGWRGRREGIGGSELKRAGVEDGDRGTPRVVKGIRGGK